MTGPDWRPGMSLEEQVRAVEAMGFKLTPRAQIAMLRVRIARLEQLRDELDELMSRDPQYGQIIAPLNRVIRRCSLALAELEREAAR